MIPRTILLFVRRHWVPLAIVAAAAAALAWARWSGVRHERAAELARTYAEAAALKERINAAERAAAEARLAQARREAGQEKELRDARKDAASPDDLRRRRGCAVMRQQGQDTSRIAACR